MLMKATIYLVYLTSILITLTHVFINLDEKIANQELWENNHR